MKFTSQHDRSVMIKHSRSKLHGFLFQLKRFPYKIPRRLACFPGEKQLHSVDRRESEMPRVGGEKLLTIITKID